MYTLIYKVDTEWNHDSFETLQECYDRIEQLSELSTKINKIIRCFSIKENTDEY